MASPVTTGGNGLAIIISNDYQNTDLKELSETHKDGEKMADVFLKLKYTIKRCKNVKMDCLQEILRDVTKPSKLYPETYRCIVFVFSGHGNLLEKEQLSFICMQDCSPVVISEIVKQFLPNSSPLIAKLPKVFLFDSCLGDKDMCQEAVVVPRGGQGSATSNFSVTGKGGTVLETISLPPNGNYILAHATSNGYKAFQLDNFGGLWINMVAEQILHSPTESVANILTNANKHLLDLYQDPIHKGAMTQPHYVSYLQDTLRFLPLPEDHRTDPPVQISFNDTGEWNVISVAYQYTHTHTHMQSLMRLNLTMVIPWTSVNKNYIIQKNLHNNNYIQYGV